MLRKLDLAAALLALLLGLAHTVFTGVFYPALSLDALWFAGTGLAFVFLGLLHLVRRTSASAPLALLSCAASGVTTAFATLLALKLAEPQAYLAVAITALLTLTSGLLARTAAGGSR